MNKDNVHTSSVKRAFNALTAAMDLAKIRKLSGGAVRIALLLLSCTTNNVNDHDNLVCRTSLDYLQTHSGFSERQVRNLLREVEHLGVFVLVDKGRNIPVRMTNTWVYDDKRIAELAKPTKETWRIRCDERDNDEQITAVRNTIAKRQNIAELRKNISEPVQDVSAFPNLVAPSLGVPLGSSLDQTYKQTTAAPVAFASPSLPEVAPLPTPTAAVRAVSVQPERAPATPNREHHLTDEQVNDMLATFDSKWIQIIGMQGTRLHGPKDRSNIAYVGRKCSEVAKASSVDIMAVYKQALRSLERVHKQRTEVQTPITDPTAYFKKALGSLTLAVTAPVVAAETTPTSTLVHRQPVSVSLNSDCITPRTRPHQPVAPAVAQNSTVNALMDVATSEHDTQHQDAPTVNMDTNNTQPSTGRELSMDQAKRLINMMTRAGNTGSVVGLARTSPYLRAAVA